MAEELSEVASAIAGVPEQEVPAPEPEVTEDQVEEPVAESEEPEKDESFNAKQLAEKLGITPRQLYAGLKLKMGETEMSLSEIKDRAKDMLVSDERLVSADKHKLDSENDLMRKQQALAMAVQESGVQLSPQMLQRAQAANAEYGRNQAEAALTAIPEWTDPAVQNADYELIRGLQNEYGFSSAEAENMRDHRMVKLFRDFSQQNKRLSDATESEVRKSSSQASKRQRRTATIKKSAAKRYASGELNQNQAILAAIAEG